THPNNLIIGVGGVINLSLVVSRVQALKSSPDREFAVLLVDINETYRSVWERVFSIVGKNESVEGARADYRAYLKSGEIGLHHESKIYPTAGEYGFLETQENYEIIRNLALNKRIYFSKFDMTDEASSKKLREVVDASGWHIDTYNVSNVAAVSNLDTSRYPAIGPALFAPAARHLAMEGTIFTAAKIFNEPELIDGEVMYRIGGGGCTQFVIQMDKTKIENMENVLRQPETFDSAESFLEDVRELFAGMIKGEVIPYHIYGFVFALPEPLLVAFFGELIEMASLKPEDDSIGSIQDRKKAVLTIIDRLVSYGVNLPEYEIAFIIALESFTSRSDLTLSDLEKIDQFIKDDVVPLVTAMHSRP
ncbi:MAG: hypothetical protein JSR93_06495, partial [Verrucomicrobia bacterium]|nr:hypothetical protein [Verrucomicrobiota bacterium]